MDGVAEDGTEVIRVGLGLGRADGDNSDDSVKELLFKISFKGSKRIIEEKRTYTDDILKVANEVADKVKNRAKKTRALRETVQKLSVGNRELVDSGADFLLDTGVVEGRGAGETGEGGLDCAEDALQTRGQGVTVDVAAEQTDVQVQAVGAGAETDVEEVGGLAGQVVEGAD